MSEERLVAVSYPVDEEFARVNSDVLAGVAKVICIHELDDAHRMQALRDAEALLAWDLAQEIPVRGLQEAARLRFLQLLSAGVDGVDFSSLPEPLLVASNAGAYAGPMSEHVVAMVLSLAKRLLQRHAALAAGRFEKWEPAQVLNGAICAVLGFGGIGT